MFHIVRSLNIPRLAVVAALAAAISLPAASLSLEVPAFVTEGSPAASGVVRLSETTSTDLAVALGSTYPTEIVVPASVVVPAGQDSAVFTMGFPEDDLLDDAIAVTISAAATGYDAASAACVVQDNEPRTITLTLPASVQEGSTATGTLTLGGKAVTTITVTLGSSSPGDVTGTQFASITAGNSSGPIALATLENSQPELNRTVTITPAANGFTADSIPLEIIDDDPASLVWAPLPGAALAGTSLAVNISALLLNGQLATSYSASGKLYKSQGTGSSPSLVSNISFYDGVANPQFTINEPHPLTSLTVTTAGLSSTSQPFALLAPPAASFSLGGITGNGTTRSELFPTVQANDSTGQIQPAHTQPALLRVARSSLTAPTSQSLIPYLPLFGIHASGRVQLRYTAAELGGASRIASLIFQTRADTLKILGGLVVRLQTLPFRTGTISTWVNTGWTTVYVGDRPPTTQGRFECTLQQPYTYDASGDLLVDLIFPDFSEVPCFRTSASTTTRSVYFSTQGASNLDQNNTVPTSAPTASKLLPPLTLVPVSQPEISPEIATSFTAGLWSSPLQVGAAGTGLELSVFSGKAQGYSGAFSITEADPAPTAPAPLTSSAATDWSWSPGSLLPSTEYELASESSFPVAAVSRTGLASGDHITINDLPEGTWWFRTRNSTRTLKRALLRQTGISAFDNGVHIGTTARRLPNYLTLAPIESITTDDFNQGGEGWVSTALPTKVGAPRRGSFSTTGTVAPELPISPAGDAEAIFPTNSGAWTADTESNEDGAIECVISAPVMPTSSTDELALMTNTVPSPYRYVGTAALFQFGSLGKATVDVVGYVTVDPLQQISTQASFSYAAGENFRVRFVHVGTVVTLEIWRLSVVNGVVVETPLTSPNSTTMINRTQLGRGLGRIGIFAKTGGGRVFVVDDLRVTRPTQRFVIAGNHTARLAPTPIHRWGMLTYAATRPDGTGVAVDLLDDQGTLIAADIPSGTDLGSLPGCPIAAPIRLRTRLWTADDRFTPFFDGWTVAYEEAAPTRTAGPWSATVSTTIDRTAPAVGILSPTSSPTATYTLAGSASDAHGVVAVTVNGVPATTSDGFANFSVPLTLAPGTNQLTIVASDAAVPPNTNTVTHSVSFAPVDADADGLPDAWESAHGLSTNSSAEGDGAAGDLDGDGVSNLLEYAFGLDPRRAEADPVEIGSEPAAGGRRLTLRFNRRSDTSNLTYTALQSSDLQTWQQPASAPEVVSITANPDGVTETVVLRLNETVADGSRLFLRVSVAAN